VSEFYQQMESWLHTQQQYWQQLASSAPLDTLTSATTPVAMAELISRLGSQGEQFRRFGENLLQQASLNQPLDTQLDAFVSYIQQQQTDLLLRRWQLPEPIISMLRGQNLLDSQLTPFGDSLKAVLATALPGVTASQRARMLAGAELYTQYQQALREYLIQANQINLQARDQLAETLNTAEPPINSLTELHQHWSRHYDSAYREAVFTDSYQQAYGNISNALMQLQSFIQQWRDEQYEQAGLVSLPLFDQVLKQQQQLRKQLRKQQQENLRLQQQLAQLQAAPWQPMMEQMQAQIDQIAHQLAAFSHKDDA